MKANKIKSHTVISDHVFRGRRSGHINTVTNLIYAAKFFNSHGAFEKLFKICVGDINIKDINAIIPIKPRDSKTNITGRLSRKIAHIKKIRFLDYLTTNNKKMKKPLNGLNVIIFDDVIYTGTTLEGAMKAAKKAGANKIYGFAIARSRNYNSHKLT